MSTLAFYAQFTKTLVGVNSLTVTWDVEQITRSDGTRNALVTGGATSIIIGRRGLYGYLLASADTKLYDYVATAITAGDVDQKEIAALWTMYEADGLKLAGQTVTAAAGVTFPAVVGTGTSTYAGGAVASVAGDVGGKVLGGGAGVIAGAGVDANVTQLNGATDPVDNLVLSLGQTDGIVAHPQGLRDALKLAPTAGAPADGSIDDHLDDLAAALAAATSTLTVVSASTAM